MRGLIIMTAALATSRTVYALAVQRRGDEGSMAPLPTKRHPTASIPAPQQQEQQQQTQTQQTQTQGQQRQPQRRQQQQQRQQPQRQRQPTPTLGTQERSARLPRLRAWLDQPTMKSALLIGAGGLSGAVAKSLTAPLERVKIMSQAGETSNFVKLMADVVKAEGWGGLWRGNTANVIRVIPNKGILLMCSDMYKSAVQSLLPSSCGSATISSVAGSLAGLTAVVLTYPLELVRTRQQYRICAAELCAPYSSVLSTLRTVFAEAGPLGLYAGVGATLIGALPFEGIKFGAYDMLKGWFPTSESGKQAPVWTIFAGAVAGALAHTLTYPLDTVRRRMQISGATGAATYSGIAQCFRGIAASEGVGALFYGLLPTVIRSVPNLGIQFLLYEVLKSLIGF